MNKLYIAYDARFNFDEEGASVLFSDESFEDASDLIKDFGEGNVLVEYEEGIDKLIELNRWVF